MMHNNKVGGGGRFYIFVCFAVLFSIVLYVPGLSGGFIFDDMPNIIFNTSLHVHSFDGLEQFLYAAYSFEPGGSSRPLTMFSFALNHVFSGLDPYYFKLTNVVINAVAGLVLFFFLRELFGFSNWPKEYIYIFSIFVALLWAVHPLQVSSVLYVVQRMQILSTLFIILSLLSYLKMRQRQMEGETSRRYGLLMVLFSLLAFASKEDAVMLPVYFFLLEIFVFRFGAENGILERFIKWLCIVFFIAGVVAYFFVIVPHYWYWGDYPWRDFSSAERLLTQSRVLLMYLQQTLFPFPDSMRFFYDDLVVSESLLKPISTLVSLLFLLALLVSAWLVRNKRPMFSFGVFLFFAAHFLTANVIGLELAFEHRNNLSILGVMVFMVDVVVMLAGRYRVPGWKLSIFFLSILLVFGILTLQRSYFWGDNVRLAKHHLNLAEGSERAWLSLCAAYFERWRGDKENSPDLDSAIKTCQDGATHLPNSAALASNVVVYKAVKGNLIEKDWDDFLRRLDGMTMSAQNIGVLWVMLGNAEQGVLRNDAAFFELIDVVTRKVILQPSEYLRLGAYIFNETQEPIRAFAHLQRAVELSSPDDPMIQKMLRELVAAGRQDWVNKLIEVQLLKAEQDARS